MYTVNWSNGIQKSTDKGLSWRVINNGLTNSYLYSIIVDDNDILLAGTDQGTFHSSDKGENWDKLDNYFIYRFFKDRFNRIYGLPYGTGLYRSTNLGTTWVKLDNGFYNNAVFGFAIDKENNLYAGTDLGYIYKSTNDGSSWNKVFQSTVTNSGIAEIDISSEGIIYASNIYEGILRSTDNGLTWQVAYHDNTIQGKYPLKVNKNDEIYAANYNTIFKSTDKGDTWKDVTDNLKYTTIENIVLDKEGIMYFATDESVWIETPDSVVNISESNTIPSIYSLEQNYPNPFNPATTIKYNIPTTANVSIKIFNSLGQEVQTLVNEIKSAGSYEVVFNASLLTSGVYFYRIQSGSFIETRKMILLR